MNTVPTVDMNEDLTEVPELTSEQLEVLAALEERFIKGRGFVPAGWAGIVDPGETDDVAGENAPIVPPDCEFLAAATDDPGEEDDSKEDE